MERTQRRNELPGWGKPLDALRATLRTMGITGEVESRNKKGAPDGKEASGNV